MNLLPLLVIVPLVSGIVSYALGSAFAKSWALFSALATLVLSMLCCINPQPDLVQPWMHNLGARIILHGDSLANLMVLLTAIVMPIVFISIRNKQFVNEKAFYGLMLLAQAGLMGVFLAGDGLLFYFFWELALIPVYFLCSRWGGERRIPVTFKFFVYTFVGSLMMLAAFIYLSLQSKGADHFSWNAIVTAGTNLPMPQQQVIFWLIFVAFAIKMPIFPFHTWQPDTYEQSPTPVTIILSALMVKMGIYAVLRWLLPVVPGGAAFYSDLVIWLSVIGIIYASCLALMQTDIKRLIAYSSIAHMGLMCAAAFAKSSTGTHGLLVQMFNHGINITGMWLMADLIERAYGTRDMKEMGGMASVAPRMVIALLIVCFANIALPLTNGFIGEFMLFNGIFQSANPNHILYMVLAGLGVILGAVYTLSMVQKVAYGNHPQHLVAKDLSLNEYVGVGILILIILVLGVYPKPLLELTMSFVQP